MHNFYTQQIEFVDKMSVFIEIKGSFCYYDIVFDVNRSLQSKNYQQPVDKVVNNFLLSIFYFIHRFGILGIILRHWI